MNIELNLDFSNCTDEEKCQALICAGLLGDPVFQNQADSTREFAICVVPGSVDELTQNLKKTHKGNVLREIKKAEEKGFGSHTFNYFNYIDDIVKIHRSKSVRGGKQISNFYRANRTEFGPKLNNRLPQEQNICAQHSIVYWGLFEPAPNPSENPSTNTEILISYIRAFRLNDIVWYNMIIGHADCLKFGVMHKMHTDLLRHYIATEAPPK